MVRAPLVLVALAGLALPTFAQEVIEPIDDCAPETISQLLGLEDNPDCVLPEDETVGEGEEIVDEETSTKNPVSIAAKLPGSNREAALAHASEMSGGKAGGNGGSGDDSDESSASSGNGNGNGKGNGKS
ncbi:hypothetical protein NIM87_00310 [Devosia sp. XJ19-1]|uniref:Uncharacterized protein n=1 Tax=Devosia ureilytica TaxID=2952754 RepID=A0A9Q4AM70_9HYPH|nr:hypothetical protein [Devosia ureilytica]MCP8881942.1 hypothetical protein [Devosia ureilytica]MCP8886172.1 hypothetical protein [Devosia ureilytica]